MTDCAMYNISVKGYHPSTICVIIDSLPDSLASVIDVIQSPLIQDSMGEFIQDFARTDEIMPSDRTLGFVVINSDRKVVSFSFSELRKSIFDKCEKTLDDFRKKGFTVEIDVSKVV
ncbi:MAG: TA0956 family protein [Thermoplasmataceae archaeon]